MAEEGATGKPPRHVQSSRGTDISKGAAGETGAARAEQPPAQAAEEGTAGVDELFAALDLDGSGEVELEEMQRLLRRGADVKLSAELRPFIR